jgi:PAS domain S-box-containing protein
MNPGMNVLRSHAKRIAFLVAELHDLEEAVPLLAGLIERITDPSDPAAPLNVDDLRCAGIEETMLSKVLRAILFEGIETFRRELDAAEFGDAVLALRRRILPAVPRLPVAEEDRGFYRRLIECDCAGLDPDHARLVRLVKDLALTFHDIVYVHDLNGTMLYVNEPGLTLAKFTAQDLFEGLNVYDLIVPEYTDLIESRLESPGAVSRTPYISEIYTKDGERIPFEITTRCLRKGTHVIGVIGLARDLRLARRLESEIRRSNAYIECIVAHAPVGIVLTDSQSVVIDVNPAAVTVFGAPNANALIGNPFYGLFEGDGSVLRDVILGVLVKGEETKLRHTQTTAFGTPLNCDLIVVPLRQESGGLDSLLVLMVDVTSQVALQQNLVQSEKLSAIGEIVAGVAHELNNPLTGILGYAQLLMSSKVDPGVHARLEHIRMEAERCRRIIQNLLKFARHYETEKVLVNGNQVLSDILSLREYQLHIDGIIIDLKLDPDLPNVLADAHDLQCVFLNIINNAQQALATVEGRQKRLAIRTFVQGDCVAVEFSDNGPGIPQNIQSRIFDPFFTTKGIGEGTGLGLSVSYGVVHSHGGRILLHSVEDAGATFTVMLPIATANE